MRSELARIQSEVFGTRPGTTYNNGLRTWDGKFASPTGQTPRPGRITEEGVWDALEGVGISVVRGSVVVRNPITGETRIYDGAAISYGGSRAFGIETKPGYGGLTPSQRAFDASVSPQNPAIGIGRHEGLRIEGVLNFNIE